MDIVYKPEVIEEVPQKSKLYVKFALKYTNFIVFYCNGLKKKTKLQKM